MVKFFGSFRLRGGLGDAVWAFDGVGSIRGAARFFGGVGFSAVRFFCVYVYQLFGVAGGVGLADTSFRVRAGHGWRPRGAGRRRELFCFGYFRRE